MKRLDMYTEILTADLKAIIPHIGKIYYGTDTELELIRNYKYLEDREITNIDLYTKYLLNIVYRDQEQVDRPYTDIFSFFNEKEYVHNVQIFLDYITIILLRLLGSDMIDVKVLEILEYNRENKILNVSLEVLRS